MNVIDIVAEYMTHKYDGLCLPEHGCACLLADLAPCAAISGKCRPGHRVNVSADTPCGCDESGTDHWHIDAADDASGSDESGADAFTPLRRTAGNLRMCAAAMPNYSSSTAGVMIGFASEIEAWLKDHEGLRERFAHLDRVLRECATSDDPIYRTAAALWEAISGPANKNLVAPRVTELLNAGVLREAGRVHDPVTGVMVSRVELSERQMV